MKNKCNVCGNIDTKLHYKNYPGYVEDHFYDIYICRQCNTNFAGVELTNDELKILYEKIYSNDKIVGYDKYIELAGKIKSEKNQVKYLSDFHASYYGILKVLKNIKNKKILDVGCGLGYLTYLLNRSDNAAFGIDISEKAIQYAHRNYGSNYQVITLDEFVNSSNEKFDFIIAAEIIEHIEDPSSFLKSAFSILKDDGKIIITTPNKDYLNEESIWYTDLPPIHLYWFSEKSIIALTEKINAGVEFISFKNYYPPQENRLIKYFRLKKEQIQKHVVNKKYEPLEERLMLNEGYLMKLIKYFIHRFSPIRIVSNFVYNMTIEKDITMVAILTKNISSN